MSAARLKICSVSLQLDRRHGWMLTDGDVVLVVVVVDAMGVSPVSEL